MPHSKAKTRETQYQRSIDLLKESGLTPLGLMTNQAWQDDPKHLLFTLSRYKFVAKMLAERNHVLEVGCADAFGTRIVRQAVAKLTATDFDPVFVADVNARMDAKWKFDCRVHDMLAGPYPGSFDGAYALDVIEHINPSDEVMLMVKGEMRLHFRTPEGKEEVAVIPEGSTIFAPTGVPHSPRFPPDAFALIMERKRRPGEIDHFLWFCPRCDALLHDESAVVDDYRADPVSKAYARFFDSVAVRTCKACGNLMPKP